MSWQHINHRRAAERDMDRIIDEAYAALATTVGIVIVAIALAVWGWPDNTAHDDPIAALIEADATARAAPAVCARIDSPARSIDQAMAKGFVVKTDRDRLVVNETRWYGFMSGRDRLGLLLSHACASGRDTVRATSDRDGRRLALCSGGDCFETPRR